MVGVWLVIAIILIFALPRKKLIVPLLLTFFNVPLGQVVVLGGLHFTVLRIMILAGLLRRATFHAPSAEEGKYPGGFNGVDQMVVLWAICSEVILSLQWTETQALIHNAGDLIDALGGYLLIRFLIPDREAIVQTVKAFAWVCVIQGAFMTSEQFIGQNLFGYLGGTSIWVTVRDGEIRSQGVLGCIYAGVFGGTLIPLFLWLRGEGKYRGIAIAGIAGALAMVITSRSSTSWMALAGSLTGLAFWALRKQMRLIRWGFALTLVGLHLVMNGPVWSLIAKVDLTGSSSSYHRFYLVNNCIIHFSDW